MKSKTKSTLTLILIILVALIMTAGGLTKLAGLPQLVELYSKIGLLPYMKLLGIVEIIFTVLFLLPRTMKIGFLLLTGYLGGAMAVELSHGTIFIAPGMILTLIWITAYLRDHSIFVKPGKNSVEIKGAVAI